MSSSSDGNGSALVQLGFDEWFQERGKPFMADGLPIVRVTQVNRGAYKVSDGQEEIVAKLSGKFMFDSESSLDYPTVGDWVVMQGDRDHYVPTIHDVLPRRSLLKRKDSGKNVGFQLIAANVDHALIMQSVNSGFDLNRLERYLVMINESKVQPIVVISKTDLASADELSEIDEKIQHLRNRYISLTISNITGAGIESLRDELQAGHTYCLLGSSGVGKTTLLNNLIGEDLYEVKEVREKDNKGRHATTRRQLVCLESGPIFIDTPGMRELGNFGVEIGLVETFEDIDSYSGKCHFSDCSHMHEKGCAVIDAVEQGDIGRERYQNFVKIQKETVNNDTSYLDKQRKGKPVGRERKGHLKRRKGR